jgi:ABC-type Na+ efflux pump permease subunit
LDITPVLYRELLVAARKKAGWSARVVVTGMLLAVALAAFGARYYWDHARVARHDLMARVALEAFLWLLLAHAGLIFAVFAGRAALSIAAEKECRTLDFLLATRLSNAEIVLGKLAACGTFLATDFLLGLPIMLLVHLVGGVDLRLILMGYTALITTGVFLIALAVWVSAGATTVRAAASASVLWWITWLVGPFFVANVFPRLGIRLPGFLMMVNAWILASSPAGLAMKIGGGVRPGSGLIEAVAWMGGLQLAGGSVLVIWAIARLRWAYRLNVSGDSQSLVARLTRPGWRWRPKPAVGDDPILWREMQTSRASLLSSAVALLIYPVIYCALGYGTLFYARHACVEVWRHGYSSGITSAERPEWNIFVRFFMPGYGVAEPADVARTELNLFLRSVTVPLVFLIWVVAAGMSSEGITSERSRETWNSLIATPLVAREILRSKMLAALWRMRWLLATPLGLWTIGLAAGGLHPIGFVASVLTLAALTWFMLTFGVFCSLRTPDPAAVTASTMSLVFWFCGTGVLPFLLPGRLNSVLLGSVSPPFVAWMTLVSYRDVRNAWHYPAYPLLHWMHLDTGEGPLSVALACLIGIIAPTLAGAYLWRYGLVHFDRLIGRPWKATRVTAETRQLVFKPAGAA